MLGVACCTYTITLDSIITTGMIKLTHAYLIKYAIWGPMVMEEYLISAGPGYPFFAIL
jgi:hypothetical protein